MIRIFFAILFLGCATTLLAQTPCEKAVQKAENEFKTGNYAKSIELADVAINFCEGNILEKVKKLQENARKCKALIEEADDDYKANNLSSALVNYNKVISRNPNDSYCAAQIVKCQPKKFVEPEMIMVEGGNFKMGGDGYTEHSVTVSSFKISKYEVTQKLWREVMTGSGNDAKAYFTSCGDDCPMENVCWYDAIEFCNRLSEKANLTPYYTIDKNTKDPNNTYSGDNQKWTVAINASANGYRLPTEAEWEFAARGGKKTNKYKFAGSNTYEEVAWVWENSGTKGSSSPDYGTHKKGTKAMNELGIFDMSGNVWEWCWDWYASDYYSKSPSDNPKGASSGSSRVLRGGSWRISAVDCRVAYRGNSAPYNRNLNCGFRVVCSS